MGTGSPERLPLLHPDTLTAEQREVYEALVGGPRGGGSAFSMIDDEGCLLGPYNAMLYSPAVGMTLQALGAAVRYRTSFSPREREIAILVVASYWRSEYVWFAHERVGRAVGLSDSELVSLRADKHIAFEDKRERVIYKAAISLTRVGDLGDTMYSEAKSVLSEADLAEMVVLVGYYATLALLMRAFRVGVPDGEAVPRWG